MCAGAQGVKWEVATIFGLSHRPGKEVHRGFRARYGDSWLECGSEACQGNGFAAHFLLSTHLLSSQLCSCRKPSRARLSSRLSPSSWT